MRPKIEVTFSRPHYRLGGTLVGTTRIADSSSCDSPEDVRRHLDSLELALVGHCKLDPRWHGSSISNQSSKNVGDNRIEGDTECLNPNVWIDYPMEENTICFWATNKVDLLPLQERQSGRWEDIQPKPIDLACRPSNPRLIATKREAYTAMDENNLVFSFRVDIPVVDRQARNLPPTLIASSCRYFYCIALRAKILNELEWIKIPIWILSPNPFLGQNPLSHEMNRSPLRVMAHSSGLPCADMTATELNQWEGCLTVHHRGSAALGHHMYAMLNLECEPVQSMHVTDPQTGKSVCLFTVMGAQKLNPGGSVFIKLDFPRKPWQEQKAKVDKLNDDAGWISVHQVSACLEGEEIAIRLRDGHRTKARSHLFDTAIESKIDFRCCESVGLRLVLPSSAPCAVKTDRVEISVRCVVDICVANSSSDTNTNIAVDYRNLRLEIPCEVLHSPGVWEVKEDDLNESQLGIFNLTKGLANDDPKDPDCFQVKDIRDDLVILSKEVAESYSLIPGERYKPSENLLSKSNMSD